MIEKKAEALYSLNLGERVIRQPFEDAVFSQIPEEDLPRYQEAAKLSGFKVVVDAGAGETWRLFNGGGYYSDGRYIQPGWRTIVIEEGSCGIRIIRPDGQESYTLFWKMFGQLPQGFTPDKV